MIMHDTRVAPIRLSTNARRVSDPPAQASTSAPSTPYAAHSVAVAQPITSTTTMNTMSSAQGMSWPERADLLDERRRRLGRRDAVRMAPRPPRDVAGEQQHQQEARE